MRLVASVLALSALSAGVAATSIAHADDQPDPTGKGIAGGILLGSEVVLAVEAAIDVEPAWAYVVGGLAGAAGGGVAGYYIEQDADPKLPLLMLASGMALAIPTTVAVLSATAYEPPNDYVEDEKPSDEPVADPPRPVGATPTSGAVRRRHTANHRRVVPALIDVEPERVTLSVPAVELRDVYSKKEVASFGLTQATEVRIPVLSVVF
jgi:hypothetical protein